MRLGFFPSVAVVACAAFGVSFVVTLLTGCSGETKLVDTDLSSAGMSATIQAPEGATVEKGQFGGVYIKKGDDFELTIRDRAEDLAQAKADCTGAQHKNCEVVTDESGALVTRWVQLGKDVHNVRANVEAGGKTWGCASKATRSGVEVDRSTADALLKTCRSVQPKG